MNGQNHINGQNHVSGRAEPGPWSDARPGLEVRSSHENEGHGLDAQSVNIRQFTLDFFHTYGVTLQEGARPVGAPGEGKEGPCSIHVDLPQEMADHFDAENLHLVFRNDQMGSDTELVAYGSRVFDKMMAYIEQQSALTVLQLPGRHNGADALLRAVQPRNAAVAQLQLSEEKRLLFVYNWRITYRADDKREELFTVVVDESHKRIPVADGEEARPGEVHLPSLLDDGEPLAPETGEDGQPVSPRLPPMTQLTRLAESARKYALYHADVQSVGHESDILPRLHKVLSRLTSYYEQQIDEVYDAHDPLGEKRRVLEEDLQRKIAEELENHRLRVRVHLISYAVLYVPVATAYITLSDGEQEVDIQVVRNRYSGALRRPACHTCADEIESLMVCRNGHVICEACSLQCETCLDVLCAACGVEACAECGTANCNDCSIFCWACGGRACGRHIERCVVCGDETCHACQDLCTNCGTRQCHSHLRMDGVTNQLLCAGCAVRCPGCHAYSAVLETCSASGQRFCINCTVNCAACARTVGPGLYNSDPVDGQAYCDECLTVCPTCEAQAGVIVTSGCVVCGTALCGHCIQRCDTCKAVLCAEHGLVCTECGRTGCEKHQVSCCVGSEVLCRACAAACSYCDQPLCEEHAKVCDLCRQPHCVECVRGNGLCEGCLALFESDAGVAMPEEPVFGDSRIQNCWDQFRWRKHQKRRHTLYLGVDTMGRNVLVVADGEAVAHMRRGRFWRRHYGLDED